MEAHAHRDVLLEHLVVPAQDIAIDAAIEEIHGVARMKEGELFFNRPLEFAMAFSLLLYVLLYCPWLREQ